MHEENKAGTLYIVATPIGNLQDMTLRAIEVLKSVDLVACEDTRVSGNLLKHFGIQKPLVSYFQHSKLSKIDYIIKQLESGSDIALVTDAGTPGISDPGQALIQRIREISNSQFLISNQNLNDKFENDQLNNAVISTGVEKSTGNQKISRQARDGKEIKITPIPGPSALTAAASISGMIEKEFYFAGFLPKKKGRQTEFNKLSKLDVPIVIYESAMRLERTLGDIKTYFGPDTKVFIAREMTKMFEEYWGGNIEEVITDLKNHQMKGEIVLIVKRFG